MTSPDGRRWIVRRLWLRRRRPFTVEALPLGAHAEHVRRQVVGPRASRNAVGEIAAAVGRGQRVPASPGAQRVA